MAWVRKQTEAELVQFGHCFHCLVAWRIVPMKDDFFLLRACSFSAILSFKCTNTSMRSWIYTYRYSLWIGENEYLPQKLTRNNRHGSHLHLFAEKMLKIKTVLAIFFSCSNTASFPRIRECIAEYREHMLIPIHTYRVCYSFSPALGE